MSEIRTHGKAKLTDWRVDYSGGDVTLEMRFDNAAIVTLDTESVRQLLELIPKLESEYQRAMQPKLNTASNPLLTDV